MLKIFKRNKISLALETRTNENNPNTAVLKKECIEATFNF